MVIQRLSTTFAFMKTKNIIFIALATLSTVACTDNTRARVWGGTEELEMSPNEVFIGAAWKEGSLWIETIDTLTNTGYIREKSAWGALEGQIVIKPAK